MNSMDEPNEPKISDPKALVDRRDFLGGATVLAGTSLLGFASPAGAAAPAEGVADRMPPIPADKWTDAQKKAAEEITSGPRKELVGPFIPLLRSPEFMSRLQEAQLGITTPHSTRKILDRSVNRNSDFAVCRDQNYATPVHI